jgi:SAM-dependent methyltransferase
VIDLGAGCGGWVDQMLRDGLFPDSELALGDSSLVALDTARSLVPGRVSCFQIDLLDLRFDARWDVAFLLDVIEHVDDDVAALENARKALTPGGLLFVTVPALQSFWSWNDDVVKHKRRYSAEQLRTVAQAAGLTSLDTRYFMFLLSPLLLASRKLKQPKLDELDEAAQWALVEKTHAVPAAPANAVLAGVFGLETPLSKLVRFPWGTSLLGVFRRPG